MRWMNVMYSCQNIFLVKDDIHDIQFFKKFITLLKASLTDLKLEEVLDPVFSMS